MKGYARMRRQGKGLFPTDEAGEKLLTKVGDGQSVLVRIERHRSTDQNAMYWAILKHVAEATKYEHAKKLHIALKVAMGLYDLLPINGKLVPVVESTAFDEMPASEFNEYFNKALDLICRDVLPGYDPQRLIAEACAEKGGQAA